MNSLKRLLIKIEKDHKVVLSIILDMQNIYIEYLDKVNKADRKHNKIRICMLEQKQIYICTLRLE